MLRLPALAGRDEMVGLLLATSALGQHPPISRGARMRLIDGLYRITTSYLCAGFVVENGVVTACAPILRKRLAYWKTIAVRVE
jgi:hypothetical protein